MAQDISGFGLQVTVIASVTFPNGFVITQFAGDADPFDTPSIQLADTEMSLNGDLVKWSTASMIPATINVIPNTDDDLNLAVLAEANRVGLNKQSARDLITLTGVYPNGSTITFSDGYITDAPAGNSVATTGRIKTKPYVFAFQNKSESNV